MATRVERTGIEACITKVNAAIEQLIEASSEIETAMNDLPNYWEGAAYDNATHTRKSIRHFSRKQYQIQ